MGEIDAFDREDWDSARLEALVRNVPGAIYRCSPESDWAMQFISDEIESVSGYPASDFIGSRVRTFASVIHEDDREEVERLVGEAIERRDSFVLEYRILHADGSIRWAYERGRGIFDESGEVAFLDGAIFDISARKEAEDRLAYLAFHDPLTELPNRALFQEHLELALRRAERDGGSIAVLFVDLDDFKLINDSFGHAVGDKVLQEVGRRLQAETRSGDVVARQGGDEFLLLVSHPGEDSGRALPMADVVAGVAARLREALARPFFLEEAELYVTASIGASISPQDAMTAEELTKHADVALYLAKDAGRDTWRPFEPFGRDPRRDLSIAGHLRHAVPRGELVLHYQPLVDLETRTTVGAEALIRWVDPTRGMIPPGDFLPIAERTGLIRPITEWVLDEACRQSSAWHAAGRDLFVSVNLPPVFWQPTTMRNILATIEAFGLSADRMMVEITEQAAMTDVAELEPVLAELHARGLRLAIDDFGTGHSSLGRLSRLRVHTLKVDRAFIRDVPADRGARVLVESIITLAANLGLHCLAEGIETEEQLGFLTSRGCRFGQGFLFGKPVPASELTASLGPGDARAA